MTERGDKAWLILLVSLALVRGGMLYQRKKKNSTKCPYKNLKGLATADLKGMAGSAFVTLM